jgi:hypothetical protein
MSATIDDDDDAPDAVLLDACQDYLEAGLRVPPVPREMVAALEEQAEWLYGTAPVDLTDRAAFVADARSGTAAPRVAFGHVGHGEASWYLCYQLIRGPLCVFVRQRFGSPYDDAETARAMVNGTIEGVEELVVHTDEARESGRLGHGQRLLVVVDEVEAGGYEILNGGKGFQDSEFPLAGALQRIGVA